MFINPTNIAIKKVVRRMLMMFVLRKGFVRANQMLALCRVLGHGKAQFLEFSSKQPIEFGTFFRSPTSREGMTLGKRCRHCSQLIGSNGTFPFSRIAVTV